MASPKKAAERRWQSPPPQPFETFTDDERTVPAPGEPVIAEAGTPVFWQGPLFVSPMVVRAMRRYDGHVEFGVSDTGPKTKFIVGWVRRERLTDKMPSGPLWPRSTPR